MPPSIRLHMNSKTDHTLCNIFRQAFTQCLSSVTRMQLSFLTMLNKKLETQIQRHKAAGEAEEQEDGLRGRLDQPKPVGLHGVHGGGRHPRGPQDARLQRLPHLLQGIRMFFDTFLNVQ